MRIFVVAVIAIVIVCCSSPPDIGCSNQGSQCYCERGASNSEACSAAVVGAGALCCESNDYPNSGMCTCTNISCFADMNMVAVCYCGAGQNNPTDVPIDSCPLPAGGGTCCLTPAVAGSDPPSSPSCSCDSAMSCYKGTVSTTSCTKAITMPGCASNQHAVPTCR